MTETTHGFAPVYHGELYYEIAGSGPAVLLIHAGVADCSMWQAQYEAFTEHFRVIRYDGRGFSKSRTETTTFSNRQDIQDLLDHLGIDKTALIGISRGGQIAIDYAIEHPGRTWALVTVAAGVSGYEHQPGDSEKAKIEFEMFSQMDELWEKKDLEALTELEVRMWADGPGQPAGRAAQPIRDELFRMIRANNDRQDGAATAQPLEPPAYHRLNEIKIPTLVTIGELDTTGTLAMADALAQNIKGARKVVFSNTAHMIPMEQPEYFNRLVLSFLRQI